MFFRLKFWDWKCRLWYFSVPKFNAEISTYVLPECSIVYLQAIKVIPVFRKEGHPVGMFSISEWGIAGNGSALTEDSSIFWMKPTDHMVQALMVTGDLSFSGSKQRCNPSGITSSLPKKFGRINCHVSPRILHLKPELVFTFFGHFVNFVNKQISFRIPLHQNPAAIHGSPVCVDS